MGSLHLQCLHEQRYLSILDTILELFITVGLTSSDCLKSLTDANCYLVSVKSFSGDTNWWVKLGPFSPFIFHSHLSMSVGNILLLLYSCLKNSWRIGMLSCG